jgi:hypothetical protein
MQITPVKKFLLSKLMIWLTVTQLCGTPLKTLGRTLPGLLVLKALLGLLVPRVRQVPQALRELLAPLDQRVLPAQLELLEQLALQDPPDLRDPRALRGQRARRALL